MTAVFVDTTSHGVLQSPKFLGRVDIYVAYPIVGARLLRQIPDVWRYSSRFIEPRLLRDVVGILGNPIPTGIDPM